MSAVINFPAPPGWTEKAKAEGRKKGREKVKKNASTRREQWAGVVDRKLKDDFTYLREWPTRLALLKAIKAYISDNGITGKKGMQIQPSTIRRWLKDDVENELRVKAIEDLIEAAITADRRKR